MRNHSSFSSRRRRGAARAARSIRRGVSIVEMLVAIVVLAVGILGLAGTAAMVSRQMRGAALQTVAATMAQSRFERLASVPCPAVGAMVRDSATARGVTEIWRVFQVGNNGVAFMYDTVSYRNRRGAVRRVAYASMRECR